MLIKWACGAMLVGLAAVASAQTIRDYAATLGAAGGYDIAARPKVTPDGAVYVLSGTIELVDGKDTFIAKHRRASPANPWAAQVMREAAILTGQTEEPYFTVKLPAHLARAFAANARINGKVTVVGRYTGNSDLQLTDNTVRAYPVLTAVAIDIEGVVHADANTTRSVQSAGQASNRVPAPREAEARRAEMAAIQAKAANDPLLDALRLKAVDQYGERQRHEDSGKAIQEYMRLDVVNKRPTIRSDYTDYYVVKKSSKLFGHDLVAIEEEYMLKNIGCCVKPGVGVFLRINGSGKNVEKFAADNKCIYEEPFDIGAALEGVGLSDVNMPAGRYASLRCNVYE